MRKLAVGLAALVLVACGGGAAPEAVEYLDVDELLTEVQDKTTLCGSPSVPDASTIQCDDPLFLGAYTTGQSLSDAEIGSLLRKIEREMPGDGWVALTGPNWFAAGPSEHVEEVHAVLGGKLTTA